MPHTSVGLLWDESVYASQVDPRRPAAFFSAPRSRGISVLVAPVMAVTGSVPVLRVALVLLSAAGLYAAFRVWGRVLGDGVAAFAALLFGGLWITQISGSQVMPNLWVALGAVAATGWFLRCPGEVRARWWLAAVLAAVTLVRTPDGALLALPLLVAAAAVRSWRPALPAVLAGPLLGAAQWVAEAYLRFGGVRERLRVSSATEGDMGLHMNIGTVLRSLDGPLLCRPCTAPGPPVLMTLWWWSLPVLTAAALLAAHRERRLRTALLPVVCAGCLSFSYLFLIGYSAPRFLLPAYALLTLPIAWLTARALAAGRGRRLPLVAAVGLLVALQLGSQQAVLHHMARRTAATAGVYQRAAHDLHELGVRPPCLLTGPRALPIGYAAGCASAQLRGNNRSTTEAELRRRSGIQPTAALVSAGSTARPYYAHGWTRYVMRRTGWTVYVAPLR
ncbi:hypothetical protein E4099_01990 [Streptomyces palmae]|uniref:Glycosyltransferase RgtA/B/C/D-like domain-containing protein n=1 Tax=Streptomyces palmae TaxID=1701085 RepID=A0A4Z0HI33_9ACTN|nr:hypothetical protein E4099_01990 [Streptomyces palmae]